MLGVSTDLAVVVVTYNSEEVVGGLLDSLPAALGGLNAEVVVVDNGSTDKTVAILELRGDCHVIPSINEGYAGGINRGVRAAGPAPAILVLNPDVRLDPGSVPPLLEVLGRDGVAITAPRVRSASGELHLSLRRDPTVLRALGLSRSGSPRLSEYVREADAYERPGLVDWALGAALAMTRACFDDLDGWDASYFLYSEETDFCLRARDRGYLTAFVPTATAVHIGGASGQNDLTHTMQILNRVRLFSRRNPKPAAIAYYALTVLSEITWVVRGHGQSRAAVRALVRPDRRPVQLDLPPGLIPR